MSEQLTAEQIGELERMLSESLTGVSPYSDEIDRLMLAAIPALTAMASRTLRAEMAGKWSSDVAEMAISDMRKAEAELAHQKAINAELLAILERSEMQYRSPSKGGTP